MDQKGSRAGKETVTAISQLLHCPQKNFLLCGHSAHSISLTTLLYSVSHKLSPTPLSFRERNFHEIEEFLSNVKPIQMREMQGAARESNKTPMLNCKYFVKQSNTLVYSVNLFSKSIESQSTSGWNSINLWPELLI